MSPPILEEKQSSHNSIWDYRGSDNVEFSCGWIAMTWPMDSLHWSTDLCITTSVLLTLLCVFVIGCRIIMHYGIWFFVHKITQLDVQLKKKKKDFQATVVYVMAACSLCIVTQSWISVCCCCKPFFSGIAISLCLPQCFFRLYNCHTTKLVGFDVPCWRKVFTIDAHTLARTCTYAYTLVYMQKAK